MPNGVDTELFAPGAGRGRAAGLARDRRRAPWWSAFVATLDRAHHFKRLDVAIAAIARLGDDGRPPGRRRRRRAARRLPRPGARPPGSASASTSSAAVAHAELPSVLRAADLFLLTTEPPESFGIVLIEAMACGLPTIATEYPGVRAVVDDGETGLVVEPGRPGARSRTAIRRLSRRGRAGARGWAPRAARRPSGCGAGRGLLDRMDEAYAEAIGDASSADADEPAPGRLLLSALPRHRRPPARGDGEVASPARPPGDRPDDLRLRPRRCGRGGGVVRTADLQRLRARLHGHDRVDALFDSDTYSGQAPPARAGCSSPSRWSPPGRRSRAREALRLNRRERFDCVITSSPPESVHAVGRALVAARRRLGRRPARRLDVRADPAAASPPRAQRRLDERLERRWLGGGRRGRLRQPPGRRGPARGGSGSSRAWSRTAGTPTWSTSPAATPRRRRSWTRSASRSSTRGASAATAATRRR